MSSASKFKIPLAYGVELVIHFLPKINHKPNLIDFSLLYKLSTTHQAKSPRSLVQLETVELIMVRYLDMRLCMVVLINMVKSPKFQIGGGGVSWEVMTWSNFFTFVLVLSAYSFVSIEVPLTLTIFRTYSFHIRLRFGNRPLFAVVAFMASLTSP